MIVGVTGLTGSGKSYLTKKLIDHYFDILLLDCDKIYHTLIEPGLPCWHEIYKGFGEEVINFDGTICRKTLGKIVFSDSEKLQTLNKITHKHIKNAIENILLLKDKYTIVVIDAPLLFECKLDQVCEKILITTAPKDLRLKRIMNRDNIDSYSAEQRIKSQTSTYLERNEKVFYIDTYYRWGKEETSFEEILNFLWGVK